MVRQAHQPGKGKRNKFNLSPSFSPCPFPFPHAQCPMPKDKKLKIKSTTKQVHTFLRAQQATSEAQVRLEKEQLRSQRLA